MQKNNIATLDPKEHIVIKGARTHNLQNVDVAIPKNNLIVITGVSGSGKSSLVIDTLYAEGQRRYIESLSAYARQFLMRMNKPDVDYIKGICPAIALEQRVNNTNPRSTVGTTSEIYDYLKLLYAYIGKTFSPVSGKVVKKHTVSDVVDYILSNKQGLKVQLYIPIYLHQNRTLSEEFNLLLQKGLSRVVINKKIFRIEELLENSQQIKDIAPGTIQILIDRFIINDDPQNKNRISDSVQTAFYEGRGKCTVEVEGEKVKFFSNKFELDSITFEEPNEHLFSFNSPYGACKDCEGFGSIIGVDEDLVIPNKYLSIYQDAVACWKGEKMKKWKEKLIKNAENFNFPIHKSYNDLSEDQRSLIWTGNKYFRGLDAFFKHLERKKYKIQYRVLLSRYRGKTICPECKGTRLRKEVEYIKIGDRSIIDIILMPLEKVQHFFTHLKLSSLDKKIADRILIELSQRLEYLNNVGLGYLTLNRTSKTLSGGETQRINLAKFLGSALISSLYILDEPSIGLHSRDTKKLIKVLQSLKDIGNTVAIVEHDEAIIRSADYIIDMGPLAGEKGGELVFAGKYNDLKKSTESITAEYLKGTKAIPTPAVRRKWNNYIKLVDAAQHNLKNITVKLPLNVLTVITGVSGSGKTTLVKEILHPALSKHLENAGDKPGVHKTIEGDIDLIESVEMVSQNPIGRSSRSNPITYVKAYDAIRKLFANQSLAKIRGYKPSHFSFNVEGGRCDTCKGEGETIVEMQFMADVHLICESCNGKRFKDSTLDIKYKGENIADVLKMTIDEAITFFEKEKEVNKKIKPLIDVGLGYVRLGQSSTTLSGGEAQRVKLASFIGNMSDSKRSLFIFDEPTTGLHFHDIQKLLNSFDLLIENGNSVLVIEHNLEVIKYADWIVDLGPEGGDKGGYLVFEGTPEELSNCKNSYTGEALKEKISEQVLS